jgi:tetratricopeptide (TPR) repeat protein
MTTHIKNKVTGSVIILLLFTMFSVNLSAQSKQTKRADFEYSKGNYSDAVHGYKQTYVSSKSIEDKRYCIFKIAECYRNIGDTQNAEIWYEKAIKANYPDAIIYTHHVNFKTINDSLARKQFKIAMVKESGVFKVPVKINDLGDIHFVFDTGASETTVTADVVSTMMRQKVITADDFLPGKSYILADGSIVNSPRFVIKKLQIGEMTFENISAVITNANADPLLGQNVLGQFKSITQTREGYLIIEK